MDSHKVVNEFCQENSSCVNGFRFWSEGYDCLKVAFKRIRPKILQIYQKMQLPSPTETKRLAFAKKHQHGTQARYGDVMFSDESPFRDL